MISQAKKDELVKEIADHEGNFIITGMIEYADEESKFAFRQFMADDESFNLYFHWFNIIHELGHVLRSGEGLSKDDNPVMEEKHANYFAVSYWKQYGEKDKLERVYEIACNALKKLKNPCGDESVIDYFSEKSRFYKATSDINDYAYIQYSLVKDAIENASDNLYKELKTQDFEAEDIEESKFLVYEDLNNQMQDIIDKAVSILKKHNIDLGNVRVFEFYHPFIHCGGTDGNTGWIVDYVNRVDNK